MAIWAWVGALVVGLTLGLLGSGGSILTVPVLVYLVGEPDKLAIAESLGIVTLISLVGMIPFAARRLVHWRSVVLFGVPGMIGAYGGAYLSKFMSGSVQLTLFAIVMLLAAVMMFRRSRRVIPVGEAPRHAAWKIATEGLVVGVITGLVGVGGGFLIVPALVLLGGLSMHLAIGTSLAIIALKSVSGFYKYIDVLRDVGLTINWDLVLLFGAVGIAGSLLGRRLGALVSQERLKQGFAAFLVVMGGFILIQNATGFPAADAASEPSTTTDKGPMISFFRKASTSDSMSISAAEYAANADGSGVLIDVRTPREFDDAHLAGAENIDLHSPDFRARVEALDREGTYYLYCRSGARSGSAVRMMRQMGFSKAYNVGGIGELARAGLPLG